METIRKIALQLVGTFAFLQNCSVIHADLYVFFSLSICLKLIFSRKPENILLCAQPPSRGNQASYENMSCKVKLVDFGNAMTPEDASAYFDDFQVQSLYYRAPEVLLGSWNFSYAIDMWSLVLGPLPAGVFSSSKFYSKYVVDPSFEVACFSRDDAKLLYELLSYIVLITDFCSEIIVVVMR
jgi:serine/threonine protein kinase